MWLSFHFFRVTSSEQENRNGWQLHLVWLSGEPSDVKVYCGTVNLRHFMGAQMPRPMEPILARNKLVPSPQLDKTDAILPEVLWEAMIHLPEMNVYWKDVRGRFLGANDAFCIISTFLPWMISSVSRKRNWAGM